MFNVITTIVDLPSFVIHVHCKRRLLNAFDHSHTRIAREQFPLIFGSVDFCQFADHAGRLYLFLLKPFLMHIS